MLERWQKCWLDRESPTIRVTRRVEVVGLLENLAARVVRIRLVGLELLIPVDRRVCRVEVLLLVRQLIRQLVVGHTVERVQLDRLLDQ